MKSAKILISLLVLILIGASCEKGPDSTIIITELNLVVDKITILDDGQDAINIKVRDQAGRIITDKVSLFFGNEQYNSIEVVSQNAGVYNLYAEYKDLVSNIVEVTVVEDVGMKYKKIVLLEQFTGTWCPWCPRAIAQISDIRVVDSNVAHIAYHVSDEFHYARNQTLFSYFNLPGYPSVMADRKIIWSGTLDEIYGLHGSVRAGIELDVSGSASEILVDVKVNFGSYFGEDIHLAVYLIEDGLIADQRSNYNSDSSSPWYQAGDPIVGLEHESVMRSTLTNIFGDRIPPDSISVGSVYEDSFALANPTIVNVDNTKIVAILLYGSGDLKDTILNSLTCNFDRTASSELVTK